MAHSTIHATKRIRQRLGLPKKAVANLVEGALNEGQKRTDFSGNMRRYLDKYYFKEGKDIRVYRETVFIFGNDGALITAWPLPSSLRRASH